MEKIDKRDILHALDLLLKIAEEHYPKYYGSDTIAWIEDLYKDLEKQHPE